MLGKYNNLDFGNRGMYLDYDKDGQLRVDGEAGITVQECKSSLFLI